MILSKKTTRGAKYLMANIAEGNLSNNTKAFAVRLCSEEIPSSFKQALKSKKWKKAMDDEMKALKKNKTWDQCALPQGKNPVGCRWIFTVKYKPDGVVERYKARMSIEEISVWTQTVSQSLVWNFTLAMKRYGFKQSNSDHTLFLKNRKNHVTCLIIYVDDMVITGNDEEEIKRLKEGLFVEFEMKDLGNLKYFFGIEVLRSPKGIFICQKNKKQKVVSLLSVEVEFICIAKGLAEALWIRKPVSEIGFPPRGSTQIMCDNKAVIQISENPVQHDRTKHVEVDRYFIKEKLEAGIIELTFVKSSDQLDDILTKADVVLLKAEFSELLLSNVIVDLAKRKNLDIDLCKLISKKPPSAAINFCYRKQGRHEESPRNEMWPETAIFVTEICFCLSEYEVCRKCSK
nr:putative RNA-directed DNA polymerase [Tanacetum cinerariifolium]